MCVDEDCHRQTHIIGVREATAKEIEYLEAYRKEKELQKVEYRRKQYLQLQEEFG
ncbi:MAG: hypothetical protein WDA42_06610 [Candidatus Bathyarchaeia archaeon]|jgi:hypothetical protein